jgi:single-strand DNA-binding protein
MADLNRVFLMGRLTRDPEVRYTPSGTAVADLGVAVTERYKDRDGNWQEKPVFVDVVVWGRQAETSAEYLFKGSPLFVEGRLQLDQWENQSGEKRSKLRVRADQVSFLGSPRRPGDATAPGRLAGTPDSPSASPDSMEEPPPAGLEDEDNIPF